MAEFIGLPALDKLLDEQWWDVSDEERWELEAAFAVRYEKAVLAAAKAVFTPHDIEVEEDFDTTRGNLLVTSATDPLEVANKIIDTINGVGYFEFSDAEELRRSLPVDTDIEAVRAHDHWCLDRWKVYGDRDPKQAFYGAMERQ